MKIRSIRLNNYKRFRESAPVEFHFMDPDTGIVNEVTLITGNNGDGKTTLLQAIASVVGAAVIDDFRPSSLNWPGFVFKYIQNGRYPVSIEVDLVFEQDEVDATRKYCAEVQEIYATKTGRAYKTPPNRTEVTLTLDYEADKVLATKASGTDSFFLTKGHQYAKILESKERNYGARFERVGSILWYDEHRTSASITKYLFNKVESASQTDQGVLVKDLVARWYYAHSDLEKGKMQLRAGQFNKFAKLKEMYESIFKGRELRGATLSQGGGNDIDIVFFDGQNEYDFSELSAGERAIFPILLDFANQNINNSIILIDEMELHLHPPLQQQFLDALTHLGRNNQFIVTTHSPFIASQFPEEQKIVMGRQEIAMSHG
jgi:predicted ATP-dependent endonuclease of OLD family